MDISEKVIDIQRKGSDAIIYGIEYYEMWRKIVQDKHYTNYRRAPAITMMALNIEIFLKAFVMVETGKEPWRKKDNRKNGHRLRKLYEWIPDHIKRVISEKMESEGFVANELERMLLIVENLFVDYRYAYEIKMLTIEDRQEAFLKALQRSLYTVSHDVQREYMDHCV